MSVVICEMNHTVTEYLERIEAVMSGASDEDPGKLGNEVVGAFAGSISNLDTPGFNATDRLKTLRGKLLVFRGNGFEDPTIRTGSVHVSATATASSSAIGLVMMVTRAIDESTLREAEKAEVKDSLAGADAAMREGRLEQAAALLEKALKVAKTCKEVLPYVLSLISTITAISGLS